MSPRQFGHLDQSTGWPSLSCCPHRHRVSSPCPPAGVWLVLHLCPACNPAKTLYCRTHRNRHAPALTVVPAPPGEDDEYRRRIGEDGGDMEN